jgi:hypothetical protein
MIVNLMGGISARQYTDGIGKLRVDTSNGEVYANKGDWIVRFHDGSTVVMTKRAFERLYQLLNPGENPHIDPDFKARVDSKVEAKVESKPTEPTKTSDDPNDMFK